MLRGWLRVWLVVGHQRRQPSGKRSICRLLCLLACGGGLAGGVTGGKPASLATLRVGVAPSLLPCVRACIPCTALSLCSTHRLAADHPRLSRYMGGSEALQVRRVGLRGVVVGGDGGDGGWLVRRRRSGARHAEVR